MAFATCCLSASSTTAETTTILDVADMAAHRFGGLRTSGTRLWLESPLAVQQASLVQWSASAKDTAPRRKDSAPVTALAVTIGVAGDAFISSAAFANDRGRSLAGIDVASTVLGYAAGSSGSTTPNQHLGSALGLVVMAGAVLVCGANGSSPDQLFVINFLGFPALVTAGYFVGGLFDKPGAEHLAPGETADSSVRLGPRNSPRHGASSSRDA